MQKKRTIIVVVYDVIRRFAPIKELCVCCYALVCILKKCAGKAAEGICLK